jgi:hypothetical protein
MSGLLVSNLGFALSGTTVGNGGSGEVLFHEMSSEIDTWLNNQVTNGSLVKKLNLESVHISTDTLIPSYEEALSSTQDIKFIALRDIQSECQNGDDGACLLLKNPTRICVNYKEPSNHIRCVTEKFDDSSGDLQFTIVFHEFLGIAGIEVDSESDNNSYSEYLVSKYLMKFARPVNVVRYELGSLPRSEKTHRIDYESGMIDISNDLIDPNTFQPDVNPENPYYSELIKESKTEAKEKCISSGYDDMEILSVRIVKSDKKQESHFWYNLGYHLGINSQPWLATGGSFYSAKVKLIINCYTYSK